MRFWRRPPGRSAWRSPAGSGKSPRSWLFRFHRPSYSGWNKTYRNGTALEDTKWFLMNAFDVMSSYYDYCIDIVSISSLIQSIISSSVGLQPARRSAHTRLCRPVERKIIWFSQSYTGSDGACLVPVKRVKSFFVFCHILDILQFSPAELLAGSVGLLGLHRCTWLAASATSAVVQFSDSGYWISLLTKASSVNTI